MPGLGGYYPVSGDQTIGKGGAVRSAGTTSQQITPAVSPNYIVGGVRQPTVAGGGGAGAPSNNITPATTGGDGVVRIIITQR